MAVAFLDKCKSSSKSLLRILSSKYLNFPLFFIDFLPHTSYIIIMGRKKRLTREVFIEKICTWVREHGVLRGVQTQVPCSPSYLNSVLSSSSKDYNPEYRDLYEQALADYFKLKWQPEKDAEFKASLRETMLKAAKGEHWEQFYEYDESGKVIRRWGTKHTIPSWVWEIGFPKVTFCQDAILVVLSNMVESIIAENPFISTDVQTEVLRWLYNWKEEAIRELAIKGKRADKLSPKK